MLDAEQAPCAARQVYGLGIARGNGQKRRTGVVRRGEHDLGVKSHTRLHFGGEAPEHGAGHGHLVEDALRGADGLEHASVPCAGACVEQVRGGGVGVFVDRLAGEQVVQILGNHEEAISRLKLLGVFGGKSRKLVNGVEGLTLDAAGAVEVFQADTTIDLRHHRSRAGVAIGHGIADAIAVRIDEHEVDAPGIDANGLGNLARLRALLQTDEHVFPDHIDIPTIVPATADLHVVESMHLFKLDAAVVHASEHMAAAGGSDVDSKIVAGIGHQRSSSFSMIGAAAPVGCTSPRICTTYMTFVAATEPGSPSPVVTAGLVARSPAVNTATSPGCT